MHKAVNAAAEVAVGADTHDEVHVAAVIDSTTLRRLAKRILALTDEIDDIDRDLEPIVADTAPTLLGLSGVGTETAAQLLVTAGDNPARLTSEAAFAHLCGASQ